MTSREFLNVAHTVLVEEFMRPVGSGMPARSLIDALQLAAPWAEGFMEEDLEALTAGGNVAQQPSANREPTEEEIVAQNQKAFAWLERRMSNVKGGFRTT